MFSRAWIVCVALASGTASPAQAGDIIVRRNGEAVASAPTFTAGAAISIACPSAVDGVAELWIYDLSRVSGSGITLPNQACGKVTVTGTLGGFAELRILIAGPDSVWPDQAASELAMPDPGVTDLGTTSSAGIEIEDADLRARTRLAVYTSADIRGDITVGQVQRIQCGFNATDSTHNGTVFANITALAHDGSFEGGDYSIGYVRAANAITGNLLAQGDPEVFRPLVQDGYSTINRVVVGPSASAAGIQGDIRAELGRINSIVTTGPIGSDQVGNTPPKTPKIWAGDGIEEVLAIDEARTFDENTGVYMFRNVNFRADIQATRANNQAVTNPGYDPHANRLGFGGYMRSIHTDGDIRGEIRAGVIAGVGFRTPGATGIFARGVCYAPITIEHVMEATMVAKRFEGPIIIGRQYEGSIIAWEGLGGAPPSTPTIASVRIGLDEAPLPDGALGFDGLYGHGFVGVDNNGSDPCYGNYSSLNGPSAFIEGLYHGTNLCDSANELLGPSLIAGASIGSIAIARMSIFEQEDGNVIHQEDLVPMIESRRIGSLQIDEFREGVVWSGQLDNATEIKNDNHADDYAQIETVAIKCMGNGAALWATDTVTAGDPAVVTPIQIHVEGNMHGRISLEALLPAASIKIDGSLADGEPAEAAPCGCAAFETLDPCDFSIRGGDSALDFAPRPTDPSIAPRNKGYDPNGLIDISSDVAGSIAVGAIDPAAQVRIGRSLTSGGQIDIARRAGLEGRVVINAANTGGAWAGVVHVAGETLAPKPAYATSSRYFGGGVVGVVPFNFYQDDAFPPPGYPGGSNPDGDPVVRTNAIDLLRVPWYGNVAPVAGKTITQAVLVLRAGTDGHPLATQPAAPDYVAALVATPFNTGRIEVAVRVPTGGSPVGGRYVVTNKLPNSTNRFLACEGFTTSPHIVLVPDFEWVFSVSSSTNMACFYERLDYTPDGTVNSDDLGDYITDFFTAPPVAGPGGYAIGCVGNAAPYADGYKAAFTIDAAGQCNEPNSDNLGDYITEYFSDVGC